MPQHFTKGKLVNGILWPASNQVILEGTWFIEFFIKNTGLHNLASFPSQFCKSQEKVGDLAH